MLHRHSEILEESYTVFNQTRQTVNNLIQNHRRILMYFFVLYFHCIFCQTYGTRRLLMIWWKRTHHRLPDFKIARVSLITLYEQATGDSQGTNIDALKGALLSTRRPLALASLYHSFKLRYTSSNEIYRQSCMVLWH